MANAPIAHTDEQAAIIHCRNRDVTVNAFAGTGKTSTLIGYAKERPDAKILYVAFNTAVAQEARARFPKNVDARTSHSLAYGAVGHKYQRKLGNPRPKTAADLLEAHFTTEQMGRDKYVFAQVALSHVNRFFSSSEASAQVPDFAADAEIKTSAGLALDPRHLTKAARLIWGAMMDVDVADIQMPHDGYLKLYQASRPVLSRYDIVLLDEAQDTNPCTLNIIERQTHCGRVFVGDRHQNIYGFRGAINAMDRLEEAAQLALTSSFRFGPEIAETANAILSVFRGEKLRIKGLASGKDAGTDACAIHRTNADLFRRAVHLHMAGQKLHFTGGVRGYQLELLTDVWNLKTRRNDLVRDSFIRRFSSFGDLADYAEKVQDAEILARLNVVDEFGGDIPRLVEALQGADNPRDQANVCLATAHKSKGLEWASVVLGEDFPDMMAGGMPKARAFMGRNSESEPLSADEANLVYVAATRAKKNLRRFPQLVEFMSWWEMRQGAGAGVPRRG